MTRLLSRDRLMRFVETRALVALFVVAVAGWAFLDLADEMLEGETHAFDTAVMAALRTPDDPSRPIGGLALEEIARDVTSLGGTTLVTAITVFVCLLLVLRRQIRSAAFVALAVIGGSLLSNVVKSFYDRPRPEFVPDHILITSASFPSGHTMLATVVYLTLATLSARLTPSRPLKVFFFATAGLVALAVGVSRVYLGVHWPTDVAAGWCAGAAWALAMWLVARWLEQRGAIEPEADAPAPREGAG